MRKAGNNETRNTGIARGVYSFALAFLLVVALLIIFDQAMLKGYNRDENQFIASGKLLQTEGLLPYRDYPYFHMPNLVFIYALIYKWVDFTLLGARSFSVLCAWGTVTILVYAAQRFFEDRSRWLRLAIGAGGVLLLLPNPLFRYAAGFAWNHDFPVLLTLAAALNLLLTARKPEAHWRSLGSGFLVGLAVGSRLTFLTALVPFLWAVSTIPSGGPREKARASGSFLGGFLVSLLPSMVLFFTAPRQFIFGNFRYAMLNTAYQQERGFEGPLTFLGKLEYYSKGVLDQPETLVSIALFALLALFTLIAASQKSRLQEDHIPHLGFLVLLPLSLLVGSFLPTPVWFQYFYAPLPFLILAILYCLARMSHHNLPVRFVGMGLFTLGVFLTTYFHTEQYPNLQSLARLGSWYPMQAHVLGHKITSNAGTGRILTLSPLFVLDGGGEIYPELASGPFAWRIADLLNEPERQLYHVVAMKELKDILEGQPTGGILVGLTKDIESPLLEYAKEMGYNPIQIIEDLTLWTP